MRVQHEEFTLETRGDGEMIDLTDHARKAIANIGVQAGLCTVFVAHSTCAMTVMEFEPGCEADLNRVLEQVAPQDERYEHNERNADTNGHSHARAGIMGPSVTIPFDAGELMTGVWQRVVCIDFDDRPRTRRVVVQVIGV